MSNFVTRARDLLTDQGLPLDPAEWVERRIVRDDGSLLVRLFGPATQRQAVEILAENAPDLVVETYLDSYVIVRP